MFNRPHHNEILNVLNQLDHQIFQETYTCFGGGTLIALLNQEFRESNDIDFICSIQSTGYKQLRKLIFDKGYDALFLQSKSLRIGRSNMDQYGIRLLVESDNILIKLEIIAEARFAIEQPRKLPWLSLPCLNEEDLWTSKLLANADRFMDKSILSRDLIDLAVLRLSSPISSISREKAESAYEVMRPLQSAIDKFQNQPEYRQKCWENLIINNDFIPRIVDGIDLLATDCNLSQTTRQFNECHQYF
ncbi:nucleotidyl transferase AbiEii/AbiGii toxin family protein [Synechocystis sp. LEGE 06083]|uniref:nucleotidyl transferase AbiEii/AbiGii toxin family protein n=1 Tax=Synechocystis sp. LEGE 06083 TaxID=915336 RepID=UPI0018805709|nr:nucleotidyl transferase AbiEii/AbiGii toxin family protein [Synechocystis sp. LEGE 06083]MBE9194268.1 nucleotidyl transferase AbiEii/AbiGii toxin family protein [Synechocystis sp. LEGE 06083]